MPELPGYWKGMAQEMTTTKPLGIKAQLIRETQIAYGDEPCFGAPNVGKCDSAARSKCCWREDCFREGDGTKEDIDGNESFADFQHPGSVDQGTTNSGRP